LVEANEAEFLAELGSRIGGTPACLSLLNEYGRIERAGLRGVHVAPD
jgi:hypothetical protein